MNRLFLVLGTVIGSMATPVAAEMVDIHDIPCQALAQMDEEGLLFTMTWSLGWHAGRQGMAEFDPEQIGSILSATMAECEQSPDAAFFPLIGKHLNGQAGVSVSENQPSAAPIPAPASDGQDQGFGLAWKGMFVGTMTEAATNGTAPARVSLAFDGTTITSTLDSPIPLGGSGGPVALTGYLENGKCYLRGEIGNRRRVELFGRCSPGAYEGGFEASGPGGFQQGKFALAIAEVDAASSGSAALPLPSGKLGCWFYDVTFRADPLQFADTSFEPSAMVSLSLEANGIYVTGNAPNDRRGRYRHDPAGNTVALIGGPFDGTRAHVEVGSEGTTKLVFYREENEGEITAQEGETSFERRRFKIDPANTTCSRQKS